MNFWPHVIAVKRGKKGNSTQCLGSEKLRQKEGK